jgi:hypothetical protein
MRILLLTKEGGQKLVDTNDEPNYKELYTNLDGSSLIEEAPVAEVFEGEGVVSEEAPKKAKTVIKKAKKQLKS